MPFQASQGSPWGGRCWHLWVEQGNWQQESSTWPAPAPSSCCCRAPDGLRWPQQRSPALLMSCPDGLLCRPCWRADSLSETAAWGKHDLPPLQARNRKLAAEVTRLRNDLQSSTTAAGKLEGQVQQLMRQGTQQKQLISQLEEDLLARWAPQQVCRHEHTGRRLNIQGRAVLRRGGGWPLLDEGCICGSAEAACSVQDESGMWVLGTSPPSRKSGRCPTGMTVHAYAPCDVCLCHQLPFAPLPQVLQSRQVLTLLGNPGLTCHLRR